MTRTDVRRGYSLRPKEFFKFRNRLPYLSFIITEAMMCRPRSFKPLLWLRCLFISSLAHEDGSGSYSDDEQYRTRRDLLDSRVLVEIHEPRKISKDEHTARGVVLRSRSPVIVIGFLYDPGRIFRNLFGMPSSRLTERPRACAVRCFPISTRTAALS